MACWHLTSNKQVWGQGGHFIPSHFLHLRVCHRTRRQSRQRRSRKRGSDEAAMRYFGDFAHDHSPFCEVLGDPSLRFHVVVGAVAAFSTSLEKIIFNQKSGPAWRVFLPRTDIRLEVGK